MRNIGIRQLLSGRPWVRIPPGTPLETLEALILQGFRRFSFSAHFSNLLINLNLLINY